MALSPRDMDFMEAKNGAAREIALAFGVPPMLLGIPGDNTYANYAEANRAFWRQTVLPLAERTAAALGDWLGPAHGGAVGWRRTPTRSTRSSAEREALSAPRRGGELPLARRRSGRRSDKVGAEGEGGSGRGGRWSRSGILDSVTRVLRRARRSGPSGDVPLGVGIERAARLGAPRARRLPTAASTISSPRSRGSITSSTKTS